VTRFKLTKPVVNEVETQGFVVPALQKDQRAAGTSHMPNDGVKHILVGAKGI